MKEALVSLIIPVYNAEKYVETMIRMIQEQTYTNLEVILVNDGSTDETEKEIYRHIGKDERFCVYNQKNAGPSVARNYGITQAKGEYIAFVDADDYIYPRYISYLYEMAMKYNADMSCCEYCKVTNTEKLPRKKENINEMEFDRETALQNMYRKKYITGYPCLKLIKRSKVEGVYFPESIVYAEDIIFIDEIMHRCERIVYGSEVLYLYLQNVSSITHKIDVEKLKKSWKYHMNYYTDKMESESKKTCQAIINKQFIMAMDLCCRVWKRDITFRKELLKYMKEVDIYILNNEDNKKIHRILGGMSCISIKFAVKMCMWYKWMQNKLKLQNKKAL